MGREIGRDLGPTSETTLDHLNWKSPKKDQEEPKRRQRGEGGKKKEGEPGMGRSVCLDINLDPKSKDSEH